jgi:hypothetical protein
MIWGLQQSCRQRTYFDFLRASLRRQKSSSKLEEVGLAIERVMDAFR